MMVLMVNPMFAKGRVLFPDFISSTTASGNSNPLIIDRPAGVIVNDLLVAVMWTTANATWTGDTGWREEFESGLSPGLRIAHRTAGGSEPSSYSFTATAGSHWGGFILAYRNANFSAVGAETRATSATSTAASVTSGKAGQTAIAVFGYSGSTPTLTTAPSGWTQRAAISGTNPAGWGYDRNVPLGATGAASLVASASSANSGVQILIVRN